tara:strand:+ start:1096 stop:1446 length:351 start_codon:yes stop_codon:yes gene_type:complete
LPLTHFKLLKGFSQESCFLADQTRRVVMKTLMAVGTISQYIFLTPSNEGRPEPFASMVYLQTNLASIAPCDKNSHISDIVVLNAAAIAFITIMILSLRWPCLKAASDFTMYADSCP